MKENKEEIRLFPLDDVQSFFIYGELSEDSKQKINSSGDWEFHKFEEGYFIHRKEDKQVKIVYEGPELKINSKEYNEKIASLFDNIKNGYNSNGMYTKWIKDSREWASKYCENYDDCHFDCECCYYAFINMEKDK